MKNQKQRVLSGTVLLTTTEREALKKSAEANSRKMTDQMRWYIVQGLRAEGFMQER
jgi:hypothetical protein